MYNIYAAKCRITHNFLQVNTAICITWLEIEHHCSPSPEAPSCPFTMTSWSVLPSFYICINGILRYIWLSLVDYIMILFLHSPVNGHLILSSLGRLKIELSRTFLFQSFGTYMYVFPSIIQSICMSNFIDIAKVVVLTSNTTLGISTLP